MRVRGQKVNRLGVELLILLGRGYNIGRHAAKRDNEELEELVFILGWEKGIAGHHLIYDATQGPHVNCKSVRGSQQDFRGPVISTLDVEESTCAVFTTGSKVNQLDVLVAVVCKQDVLGLHVTVNHPFVLHELEALDHLESDPSHLLRAEDLFSASFLFHVFVNI
jgi:hypothetical protein